MARTASNPLPQFITSPDLGAMIAAELRKHAEYETKQVVQPGLTDVHDELAHVRIQIIRNAADELDRYCEEAASAR